MTDQPSALHIGIASIDITPPVGTVMVGYTARRSVRVAQPLRADALVCKGPDGTTPWALITCDTIGYTHAYARRIREAIAAATAIPASAIVLAGTHTHSGPCTIAFGRGESLQAPDHRYLESLPGKLVALVQRALDHAAPGSIEIAQTAAPGIGHNRRVQHADGTWGNQWQDPDGKHTGYYDPTILLAAVRRPNGRREALLVNFGCHPVVLGPRSLELSGDYVTYLRQRIEAETDIDLGMFALAACGNINPRHCIRVGAEHPRAIGEAIAQLVLDALPLLTPVRSGIVASHSEPWSIARTRPGRGCGGEAGDKVGEIMHAEIVALRAGDLGFIAVPGEPFSEFNPRLREASPTPHTVIVTLANAYPGYLPTDQAQREGAYETSMAPADRIEQPLMERARRALAGVADEEFV